MPLGYVVYQLPGMLVPGLVLPSSNGPFEDSSLLVCAGTELSSKR